METNRKITFEETIQWFQDTDYTGGIGLTVKFPIPPENINKFVAFCNEYTPYVLEEEGCLEFGFQQDWQNPNTFWLTERWASPQILLAHLGPEARKGTKFEGETPLQIMASLKAQPDPVAIYLLDPPAPRK